MLHECQSSLSLSVTNLATYLAPCSCGMLRNSTLTSRLAMTAPVTFSCLSLVAVSSSCAIASLVLKSSILGVSSVTIGVSIATIRSPALVEMPVCAATSGQDRGSPCWFVGL